MSVHTTLRPVTATAVAVSAALALLLSSPTAECRVFKSEGNAGAARKLERIGGAVAYESRVTVNGVAGDLTVFGFDTPIAEVTERIGKTFGTNFLLETSGPLATGVLREGDRQVHLLVSEPEPLRTIVFVITLDRQQENAATPTWPVAAVPLIPGGSPLFSFENPDTKTRFAIAKTAENADSARSYCDSHLRSKGWRPQGSATGSLIVYARGQDLCVVMVQSAAAPGGTTRVAVMEKRLGTP